jgi:hypothetical protein
MGSIRGIKRGPYSKTKDAIDTAQLLEVTTNRTAIEAQLNMVRGRIRMFETTMRSIRKRLVKLTNQAVRTKMWDEYQIYNQKLYLTKKVENTLTYQKNLL